MMYDELKYWYLMDHKLFSALFHQICGTKNETH